MSTKAKNTEPPAEEQKPTDTSAAAPGTDAPKETTEGTDTKPSETPPVDPPVDSAPPPPAETSSGGDMSHADLKLKKADKPAPEPAPAGPAEEQKPKLDISEVRELEEAHARGQKDKAAGKSESDSPYRLQGLTIDSEEQPELHKVWLAAFRA